MSAHTPEALAHEERRYFQIFIWLGILTVLEIGITYLDLSKMVIGGGLVLLAGSKAALVALYYMHLAQESRTLTWIALTPAILCVFLVFMLLPDLGAITRLFTEAMGAAPAAH
jgi:cytochrome c oxidase subunit 4